MIGYQGASIFQENNLNPLSILPIVISQVGGHHVVKPTDSDAIIKCVGLCLPGILKNEFGDAYVDGENRKKNPKEIMQQRNPLLANLTPSQALANLKIELKAFTNNESPFNRVLREEETVYDWWTVVQRNRYASVLGVHSFPHI